ncbi:MAG TPA: type 1 glutamine amidotransferase domain-containing protein [Stellaceae bacterium]|nr:type 1 glutamine amidotransferase domain-containing protein [Stellaceae bacterium]
MAAILMPLPKRDFDPTETGVPWRMLSERGHRVVFATPDGRPAEADPMMVTGTGLGVFARFLKADQNGRRCYGEMTRCDGFRQPILYDDIRVGDYDALLLPGGHAKGMRPYLESERLQAAVVAFFAEHKAIGAICHGVVLAARSRIGGGKSILYGRKTTSLTKLMELSAWALTALYLGDYYRTYPTTVEDEVRSALARRADFITGPVALVRDGPERRDAGFTLRDGNYLSARWPGDAHRFASDFAGMVERPSR